MSRQWNVALLNPSIKFVRHGGDGYFSKKSRMFLEMVFSKCIRRFSPSATEMRRVMTGSQLPILASEDPNNILTFEIIGAVTVPDADWHIDGQWVLAITQCFLLLWKLVGVFLVLKKKWEEMGTTHGEFTGPGAGGAGRLHPQHAGRTPAAPPQGALQVLPPTITDQAPAWLRAWIHKKMRRETAISAHLSICPRNYCPAK